MGMRKGQIVLSIFFVFCLNNSQPATGQIYFKFEPARSIQSNPGISLAAVGDVMLGSWVIPVLAEQGADYPFKKTDRYLETAGVAIANLEAPFTEDTLAFEKKFNFKVPTKYASGLLAGGFDVVTLANNHIMDFGEGGLLSTIETLDEIGIRHCGAGGNLYEAHQPAVFETNGKRIAFFGYSMTFPTEFYAKKDSSGTAYPEPELMQHSLEVWENFVDFTVVSFHWSAEKRETPKDYQVYFAHLAIDSGADLILGHHPHVLQGIELYKNRLIAYSLGNFAFGSYSKLAVDSIILKAYLNDDGLQYAQCIPINVDNREVEFQPALLDGERKEAVLSKLSTLSLNLNNGRNILGNSGIILGDWAGFHDDWLLNIAVSTFWDSGSTTDILESAKSDTTEQKIKTGSTF